MGWGSGVGAEDSGLSSVPEPCQVKSGHSPAGQMLTTHFRDGDIEGKRASVWTSSANLPASKSFWDTPIGARGLP